MTSFFQKDPLEQLVKALEAGQLPAVKKLFKDHHISPDVVIPITLPEGKVFTTPLEIAIERSDELLANFLVGELGALIVKKEKEKVVDIRVDAENKYRQKPTQASKAVCQTLDKAEHKRNEKTFAEKVIANITGNSPMRRS